MRRLYIALLGLGCAAGILQRVSAVTINELGSGPAETAAINCAGIGTVIVNAGILKLDVDGVIMEGFCVDPFHFSNGSMAGYQLVPLTSAPKGNLMSAGTATEIARLWGSYYSPTMSNVDAAGLQIAIWELTGGSGFTLVSGNDFGAAGFLHAVEDPNYDGPVAELAGLTGPGQDYAIQGASINVQAVPEAGSTLMLLGMAVCGLAAASRKGTRWLPSAA